MNGRKLQVKFMKVLIFGGAGFVGRYYVEHFLKKKILLKLLIILPHYLVEFIQENGKFLIHTSLKILFTTI